MRRHEVRHHVHTRRSDERHLGRTWEDGRWGGGGGSKAGIESLERELEKKSISGIFCPKKSWSFYFIEFSLSALPELPIGSRLRILAPLTLRCCC
jgi:hypothetical protein